MKIKSNFTDYYDYISNQYGGGDPKTIYIRHTVDDSVLKNLSARRDLEKSFHIISDIYFSEKIARFGYLACAGKLYILQRIADDIQFFYKNPANIDKSPDEGSWKLLSQGDVDYYESLKSPRRNRLNLPEFSLDALFKKIHGVENENVVELSKALKAPVFMFTRPYSYTFEVSKHVPSLASMGMQAVVDPQSMYRDLEFFINNVLRDSPDLAPPVQVSDKDRVVQHGFDLKQSFRHRK